MIASDGELRDWGYTSGCLAAKDRYAFLDISAETEWIQRIDMQTGESVPWRKAEDGGSFELGACPLGGDSLVYVGDYLTNRYLFTADPQAPPASIPDELLSNFPEDTWIYGSTSNGDLLLQSRGSSPYRLIALELEEGQTLGKIRSVLHEGWASIGAWSPDGHRFSWITNRPSGNQLFVWDARSFTTRSFQISTEQRFYHNRWFPDGQRIGMWGSGTEVSGFGVLDLNTGSWSLEAEDVGVIAIGPDSESILVQRPGDTTCIDRLDLGTKISEQFLCLTDVEEQLSTATIPIARVSTREFHDYSRYVIALSSGEGLGTAFGTVSADGTKPTIAYWPQDDEGRMGWFRYQDPETLTYARFTQNSNVNSIHRIDLATKESSPYLESITKYFEVFSYQVSPDGRLLLVMARSSARLDSSDLTIMHNVLGDVPDGSN